MSYSISIYGHGAPKADVERVFATAVRELRKATPEGQSQPGGSASGSDLEGGSISINATDVTDEAPTEGEG